MESNIYTPTNKFNTEFGGEDPNPLILAKWLCMVYVWKHFKEKIVCGRR
jgi:hypothetical protein